MKKSKNIYFIAALFFIAALSARAPHAEPFSIPEKFTYDLTWAGIKTGEASLEIRDNGSDIQFISKAASAGWVSVFYRVEDNVVSTLKKEGYANFAFTPKNYRLKIREGKHKRDREIVFDHTAKKAVYINRLDNKKTESGISGSTFDPLSSLYYLRGIRLEVGKPVFIDIFDSKKLYKMEVQVLKKEIVETPSGTFKTILIKPLMRSEGIFYRKGDILVWLTDDNKRIPVLLKTKVSLGSVKAALTSGNY
ncbi:MAG TPA: DUF3108 domain-containing protein [Nitrospiraceae bacterium]|nr:MAG: hypothetical protein A2Z82_04710 [Nitrospirae bacterium GWA2_46_11]OGW23710.1 MAG: hypothetical protein A2X55_06175 [Nitrospirae bacterium GWB2_47_37]HAK89117.1 DUF3108 domain-containing protein [Nitrospiraceae bacterium]HCL82091.1 DUF3108 domain-containing protein [Nitrospiraceae bacterium]